MLASLNLLNRFVSLPKSPVNPGAQSSQIFDVDLIRSLLTKQGFEVESASTIGADFEHVVVGQIVDTRPHPQADRLKICKVNLGDSSPRQIVCGAPNARADLYVAVALPGSKLPGGISIEETSIRGIESRGMLCSRQELGLATLACDGDGIWELNREESCGQPTAKLANCLGKPVFQALELIDVILDVSVTPNRPDALCHLGLAREIYVGLSHRAEGEADLEQETSPVTLDPAQAHEPVVAWHGCSWMLELGLDARRFDAEQFAGSSTAENLADLLNNRAKNLGVTLLQAAAHPDQKDASSAVGLNSCSIALSGMQFRASNELGVPAFFMGFENIKTKPSPAWLRTQLEALGQNTVNDVVDLSNFILICLGQPSHAFDLRKLGAVAPAQSASHVELVLRKAQVGSVERPPEKFLGLDGKTRELHPDDCVVASCAQAQDGQTIQALLGVIGGELSKVDETTVSIVVEWANPESVPVRRTSRRIGRKTDSSFQFEKGLDRAHRHHAAALFLEILQKLQPQAKYCGAAPAVNTANQRPDRLAVSLDELPYVFLLQREQNRPAVWQNLPPIFVPSQPNTGSGASDRVQHAVPHHATATKEIIWNRDSLECFTGANICSWEAQLNMLQRLGFQFSAAEEALLTAQFFQLTEAQSLQAVRVHIPHWRLLDIAGEADIAEEIVRVVGLDLIPGQPMIKPLQARKDDGHLPFLETVACTLAHQGYNEVTSFHFMKENDLANLGLANMNALGVPVRLLNPIIADEPLMHTTLLPDLLRKAKRNINYGTKSGQLFHICRTYQNMDFSGRVVFSADANAENSLGQPAESSRQLSDSCYSPSMGLAYSFEEGAGHRPVETPRVAGLAFGEREEKSWNEVAGRGWILHDFIGHVLDLASQLAVRLDIERLVSATQCPLFTALHPGRCVLVNGIRRDGTKLPIGFIGQMHPRALRLYEVDAPTFAFELNLAGLYWLQRDHSYREKPHYSVHRLPLVHRDFAFLFDARTPASQVQSVVESALTKAIETEQVTCRLAQFKVFDVYLGNNIPAGKKSMAFQISVEPLQETLSDAIIQKLSSEVVKALELSLAASLR